MQPSITIATLKGVRGSPPMSKINEDPGHMPDITQEGSGSPPMSQINGGPGLMPDVTQRGFVVSPDIRN